MGYKRAGWRLFHSCQLLSELPCSHRRGWQWDGDVPASRSRIPWNVLSSARSRGDLWRPSGVGILAKLPMSLLPSNSHYGQLVELEMAGLGGILFSFLKKVVDYISGCEQQIHHWRLLNHGQLGSQFAPGPWASPSSGLTLCQVHHLLRNYLITSDNLDGWWRV